MPEPVPDLHGADGSGGGLRGRGSSARGASGGARLIRRIGRPGWEASVGAPVRTRARPAPIRAGAIRRRPPAFTGRRLVSVSSLCLALLVWGCGASETEWRPLFNGRDLSGWTPKIRGYALGEDPLGTFRVEDGLLTVRYERYDDFGDRFGHLFFEEPFTDYRLLVEYRFVGEQAPGGEAWAFENSGIMVHAQPPGSMPVDQDFPISLEAQLLGGTGSQSRPTANLCTPGTHAHMDGRLVEEHCIESSSPTFRGDEWVTVELIVRGGSSVTHLVDGDTVLTYERPIVGGGVVSGFDPAAKPDGEALSGGWIALQSESHPVQFRRVLLKRLHRE